jgi:glycine/sarcosine N-methyltransferase
VRGNETWAGLAPFYDRLFPPRRPQLDFIGTVVARMHHPARRLLDVGCATGGYSLALAEAGFAVTGVDLAPEMVRLARAKAAGLAKSRPGLATPRFLTLDMTDLQGLPQREAEPFGAVICLGNTLSSLLSAAELGTALGEMARVLGLGGKAIFQVVNYDRMEAAGDMRLPPIILPARPPEHPELVFRRLYLQQADGLLSFATVLQEAGGTRVVFRSESVLRPITRDELAAIARLAFHGAVEAYGDFLFSPWTEASPATVVVATREE